jgi:hypothetical protein
MQGIPSHLGSRLVLWEQATLSDFGDARAGRFAASNYVIEPSQLKADS